MALAAVALLGVAAKPAPPDPVLSVDAGELESAWDCVGGKPSLDGSGVGEAVLLVHGTSTNARENFAWNLMPWLAADGFDVCWVELPGRSMGDIQVQAEYVVHALRRIASVTGEQVDVVGHSQGGLQPRWAVRWWPQTVRPVVDDLVMIAVPNHGTVAADSCHEGESLGRHGFGCFASAWQMARVSSFVQLLNSGDVTPGDVSYTSIYTWTDELVQPQLPTSVSALDGARNLAVQEVCPGRVADHLSIIGDGVTYDLVVDALLRAGASLAGTAQVPADPAGRAALCAQAAHELSGGLTFEDGRRFFGDATDPDQWRPSTSEPAPAPYTHEGDPKTKKPKRPKDRAG